MAEKYEKGARKTLYAVHACLHPTICAPSAIVRAMQMGYAPMTAFEDFVA